MHKEYRVSQKKRSLRISKPLGPTDASSGDNSVGKGCWGDLEWWLDGGGQVDSEGEG